MDKTKMKIKKNRYIKILNKEKVDRARISMVRSGGSTPLDSLT